MIILTRIHNRRGHYGRALEEALQTQRSQWPRAWNGINPLAGSRTFNSMTPQERVRIFFFALLLPFLADLDFPA